MKIKTEQLKTILNLEEKDLKKLSIDQLRLLLGVSHYVARLTQRELNSRLDEFSVKTKR
jgi:hypothetical protein